MKISELVHYRELLDTLIPKASLLTMQGEMDSVLHAVDTHKIQMPEYLDRLQHLKDTATSAVSEFSQEINRLQIDLLEKIAALEPIYFARSYQWYEQVIDREPAEYVLNRRLPITDDTQAYIQTRVQAHSNWKYAGLLIRPGLEEWIEHMVACDPLYVVDTHHEMFGPAKERFNPVYQNRLRYYAVKENSEESILQDLPDGQFGFCLAYNFFHYKPFEIMRKYLREIYQKLQPGGVLGMTFSDCDRRGAVDLAERSYTCYTPGRLVLAVLEDVGFVISQNYRLDAAVNWVELRKPGQIRSMRGGQALAKIVAKSK